MKLHYPYVSNAVPRTTKQLLLVVIALLLWVMVATTFVRRHISMISPEVAFTDIAPSGLAIVPASCASSLPATLSDANGNSYKVPVGASNMEIVNPRQRGYLAGVTDYYCITNNGPFNFFLGAKTHAELQSFYNSAGSLTGISVTAGPGTP